MVFALLLSAHYSTVHPIMYIEMVVKRNVYITLLGSPFQQVALAFMWGSLLLPRNCGHRPGVISIPCNMWLFSWSVKWLAFVRGPEEAYSQLIYGQAGKLHRPVAWLPGAAELYGSNTLFLLPKKVCPNINLKADIFSSLPWHETRKLPFKEG